MLSNHTSSKHLFRVSILTGALFLLGSCDLHKPLPSDVYPEIDQWSILLGDGTTSQHLIDFQHREFFTTTKDHEGSWIVFKTPNSGITSRTSSNTRSELGEIRKWTLMEGGNLSTTVKVMHTTASGNPSVPAAFSVVIGQIHSVEGHENEPLKIFYRKYPGHKLGSVFWNYEINTEGNNNQRWDVSFPIWGNDMSVCSTAEDEFPDEPKEGIALGEAFSYSVSIDKGVMTLEFTHPNKRTKRFKKSLIQSTYSDSASIPSQVRQWYEPMGRKGIEQPTAYTDELQIFKIGAYNQSNGKSSLENSVWYTDAETYQGNITEQYKTGNYVEVWFKNISVEH